MELWKTDAENELICNFVQTLHVAESESHNKVIKAIMGSVTSRHEPLEKTTTVAHLRNEMVACSESYESIVGAAALENLTPVSDEQVIEGYKRFL